MNKKCFFLLLSVIYFGLFACTKETGNGMDPDSGNSDPIGSSKTKSGIGPNAGMPEGKELQLPPCVRIVNRPGKRFDNDKTRLFGSSQAFYVAVSFVNTCCGQPVDVVLPPGMMITSDDGGTQNGLLVENVYFTVPPRNCTGGTPDTTTVYIALACLNENRTPPVGGTLNDYNVAMSGYTRFNVTTDANLLKFLLLLKNTPGLKVTDFMLNTTDPTTSLEKMHEQIQNALWKITDGPGLTAAEVETLKSALKAYK